MPRHTVLIVATTLGLVFAGAPVLGRVGVQDRLVLGGPPWRGDWRILAIEVDGTSCPRETWHCHGMRFDRCHIYPLDAAGRIKEGAVEDYGYDVDQEPVPVDLSRHGTPRNAATVRRGILTLRDGARPEDRRLRLCHDNGAGRRPDGFRTAGTGRVLFVLAPWK